MNKLKQSQFRVYIALALLVAVSVIGVGLAVKAFTGTINNVENFYEADGGGGGSFGAMSSPFWEVPYVSHNGEKTYVVRGTCDDADVDIFSFQNPFDTTASTTVVESVRIRIDGVSTTTSIFTCGAQTAEDATPSFDLMTTGVLATSTGLGCIMENTLLTADNGNSACPDGGTVDKITLSKMFPWFGCEASEGAASAGTTGITNANNTFSCSYMVKLRQMN